MKRAPASMALLISVLMMSGNSYSQDDIPFPDGPYLGQTPPGSTPEIFAPGIVNTEENRDVASSSEWTLPSDAEIQALLTRRMEHNGVGIVVGVIDSNGRRVISYGRTGADDNRPLDGDTIFQLGSVTKGITSLLLAEMISRGEVELHDAASAYLPADVVVVEEHDSIRLYHLSTHVSGLPSMPSNFDINGKPDPYEAYTVEQLHDFLRTYEPKYYPGRNRAYSNLGVSLLGRLLANRMDTTYEALVKERVLEPLGMNDTSITLSGDQLQRLAPGHSRYLKPIGTWEMKTLQASGSLRSSANDMLKLIAAYLGHEETPLKAAVQIQLLEECEGGQTRPLAWGLRDDGTYLHSGGKAGYRSGVAFNPATGIGAVVLANARTDDRPIDLAYYLVTGEPMDPAAPAPQEKPTVELPQAVLDSYVGRYRFEDGGELEVVRNGSRLIMRYPNFSIFEFEAFGERDFFYNAGNDDVTFVVDATGHVTSLTRFGDGKEAGGGEVAERMRRSKDG